MGHQQANRRAGGRAARIKHRSNVAPPAKRPVRGGLTSGRYAPLTSAEVKSIHASALTVLAEIGFADATPSCIEYCTQAGAIIGSDNRLRFPKALVEDTVSKAARHFVLPGQSPEHDIEPWGSKVYYCTAGAAVSMHDAAAETYRPTTLQDCYDAARLVDHLDNIHMLMRPLVATDMSNNREFDINTLYASISGTTKPVGTSHILPEYVRESLEMLHIVAGGEERWRARPFVLQSNCFVVPPLKFAQDACDCLEAAVLGGMPVVLLSAGQAGATAPAALAGAVVQAVAEALAAFVYVNAIVPGHPCIMGLMPFVSDLRTGAMSGGSGEQALLTAACAQMAQFYDLSCVSAGGISDAKGPDAQSGYEKGMATTMAGLAGLNMVWEAAGMHASLLGFSFESLIIDNDMLGQSLRAVRGIEVSPDTLSVDTMRDVCLGGPGHYLGHAQTLSLMETEYLYPDIANRMSPKEWAEAGHPVLVTEASKRVKALLETHFPTHITDSLDEVLRAAHPIRLPRSLMQEKTG